MKISVLNHSRQIKEYIVENSYLRISFLNIGAAIFKLFTRNKDGAFNNIVLSLNSADDYLINDAYYGVTIGRNSGRISGGKFLLNGIEYDVKENISGANNHSGGLGTSHRLFDCEYTISKEKAILNFKICLLEKDDLFPGNIDIQVRYTIEKNNLKVEYFGTSKKDTICNLTNHSYFNLNNEFKSVLNHELTSNFTHMILVDENGIPNDKVKLDKVFENNKSLHEIIQSQYFKITNGIDNPFLGNQLLLKCQDSGRKVEITTSYPSIVLYSQNYPNNHTDKTNHGLAIECQFTPNDINIKGADSRTILRAGNKYNQWINYKFEN